MAVTDEPEIVPISATGSIAADDIRRALDRGATVMLPGAIPVPPTPGIAALVGTSGTTGAPQTVMLTYDGLHASARMIAEALGSDPGASWLCCLPLRYVAGLAVVARAWSIGAPVVTHERFDATLVHEEICRRNVKYVSLVSTALVQLLDRNTPLELLDGILLGGGPISPELVARAHAHGARVHTTYGMTETWGGIVHDGMPLSGVELRIRATDDDAIGDIEVRTPTVMRGYADAEATANAFADDGWLRTGDLGTLTKDGVLHVVDRRKDLIITGGVKVIPAQVEQAIATLTDISDCAVLAAPDDLWGERVVACITTTRTDSDDALVAWLRSALRDQLPAAALPRQVLRVEEIPRSAGGKLLRHELRTRLAL
jgi:O-succinylbenzoic acid--CoA ligase